MKTLILPKAGLVLALATFALAGCTKQSPSESSAALAKSDETTFASVVPVTEVTPPEILAEEQGDISDAAVKPAEIPNAVTTPVQLTPALSEMVRLAQTGVDESVLVAYVTNSTATFNAGPEEIIYLNDIGISSDIITAMLVRDRELRDTATAVTPIPTTVTALQTTPVSYTTPSPTMVDPSFSRQDAGTETFATPAQPADVTTDDFYGSLAPYGNWVDVAGYGRCWQPTVVSLNSDWRPYCDGGRWVYTDCGWYWLSDYSWGWAPFHYGRWFRHTQLGWCWVPDTTWGPSWVSWRYSNDYCGWAPLPPLACFRPGIGFTYGGSVVSASFEFGLTPNCFVFLPFNNFCDRHPSRHIVARRDVDNIYHRTTVSNRIHVRNHIVVNNGLPADRVTAITHNDLHPVAVRQYRGTAGRGLRLQHLESDGTALTTERPGRTTPTQPPRHPAVQQPANIGRYGSIQANAGAGNINNAAPSQMITRPDRFANSTMTRANTAPAMASANPHHDIYISSYPDNESQTPSQIHPRTSQAPARQNPSWLQTRNGFDNRRQPSAVEQPIQQIQRQAPNYWNIQKQQQQQALAERRNAPREIASRSDYGNSFSASQSPTVPQYAGAQPQPQPRVSYQPLQNQFQQNYSPPPQYEPRSNYRPQPVESRQPAMESHAPRSEPRVTESRPAPAPAPVTHERSSSNDHSSQDHQSSGRSR